MPGDLSKIDDIYQKFYANDFSIPNLNHTIGNGVVSNSSLVAFGMVKLYPEAIIVIDQDLPSITKTKALRILYEEAIKACKSHGFNELNAHVLDSKFLRILEKLGFKSTDSKQLQLELRFNG